jgi:hypothetical protein
MAKYTAAEMINAIDEAKGTITKAAEILGCSRQTIYTYADRYTTVQQCLDKWSVKIIDDAEFTLFEILDSAKELVNENPEDPTAIREARKTVMSVLKTKGKNRGWTERQEITGKDGEPLDKDSEVKQEIASELADMFQDMEDDEAADRVDKLEKMEAELDGGDDEC